MIKQNIYLEDWDWYVKVFYAVDTIYMDEVLGELEALGCSEGSLQRMEETLYGLYNVGLTCSKPSGRCSVVVIGLTTSAAEFQNTFDHEKGHLAMHIADTLNIDIKGEEFQYLTGEIGQKMFSVAKRFLCDCCRKRIKEWSE